MPTASVSAVLMRTQRLVAEPVFADDNLLQHFLFLSMHVNRNNIGICQGCSWFLQPVLDPRSNEFRASNPFFLVYSTHFQKKSPALWDLVADIFSLAELVFHIL